MESGQERTILLVGGAGYVGSHAAKFLKARGFLPVVYDNLVYGHREAVQWGPFEEGSLGDRKRLREVFARHRPLAVLHFAAFAYVGESVQQPDKYYRNNVMETIDLLDTMLESGVKNFIFSSTCATYGLPGQIPITEDQPQNPVNPYGRTKLMVEQILEDYEKAYGLKSVCLRYFNAAGADPDGEIGENHDPETHLIPLVLEVASGMRECIDVYGTDYPTADGTCVRDYIHVTDLAQAHWQALTHLFENGTSARLNLGNGKGYSVQQVIDTAEKITGCKIKVHHGPRREGDPPELVGSAARARELLGWKPEFPELEQILSTAWRWHCKQHGATRVDR